MAIVNLEDTLSETFAPIVVPPDPPGMPYRSQMMQVPSDQLRDAAKAFAKRFVALIPEPAIHEAVINALHDLVVSGERALEHVLETHEDFKRDGYTFDLGHAPLRVLPGLAQKVTTDGGSEAKAEATVEGGAGAVVTHADGGQADPNGQAPSDAGAGAAGPVGG